MNSKIEPLLGARFIAALQYAAQLHATQTRKGTQIPYVAHLLAVASVVLEAGGTEDEAIAALLHDGPEDQGGLETLDDIRTRFGEDVAAIVEACSDTFDEPKPPWKQRKVEYLEHLRTADVSTLLVSAADKLHNARATVRDLRELGTPIWDRFKGGRDGTLWYYSGLLDGYKSSAKDARRDPIVDELASCIHAMQSL